jgi:exodeoxyribonuclease VII small subunit
VNSRLALKASQRKNNVSKKKGEFEQSLAQLEAWVAQLEKGDLPLNEALALFERAVGLTRQCHEQLSSAQQRVEILLKENGQQKLAPFATDAPLSDD